jgi:hypothetical protein
MTPTMMIFDLSSVSVGNCQLAFYIYAYYYRQCLVHVLSRTSGFENDPKNLGIGNRAAPRRGPVLQESRACLFLADEPHINARWSSRPPSSVWYQFEHDYAIFPSGWSS